MSGFQGVTLVSIIKLSVAKVFEDTGEVRRIATDMAVDVWGRAWYLVVLIERRGPDKSNVRVGFEKWLRGPDLPFEGLEDPT